MEKKEEFLTVIRERRSANKLNIQKAGITPGQKNMEDITMNKIVEELKKTGVFYVATMDGEQPRVRPFSSVCEFEEKVYICSNNTKKVYKQICRNPKTEISGMGKDGTWIRVTGKLIRDDRDEARAAMLADATGPSNLYTVGDGLFEVFYIQDAVCTKYSFTGEPVIIQ